MAVTILAIPGFLGLPSDWDFLGWEHLIGVDVNAFAWTHLMDWAEQFNNWVAAQQKAPAVLMGYSLGGRLALHALLYRPEQWKAAIIISAHPGLSVSEERVKRLLRDREWAARFEKEEWVSLMQAWNGQEVFAHDQDQFQRQESHYQRRQLAHWLLQGSLAKQADLSQQIQALSFPILWVTGALDERYGQIAQRLAFAHPQSRWESLARAGHRVPWAQPERFSQAVSRFLSINAGVKSC